MLKYVAWKLFRREEGASMVEYGLLLVLVALVAAAGLVTMGGNLSTFFEDIGASLSGATVPTVP